MVDDVRNGRVRVIARESDLEAFRNQTVRMNFTNMNVLTTKADQLKRFVEAYEETLEWMYSDPKALKTYAEFADPEAKLPDTTLPDPEASPVTANDRIVALFR